MERLTIRNSDGTVSQPLNLRWADALERLAAYEDTGLDSEEVAKLAHGETERNAPLTLDELSKMDGEPVWVVLEQDDVTPVKGYGIVDNELECVSGLKFMLRFEDYGVWLAYRCKLENAI